MGEPNDHRPAVTLALVLVDLQRDFCPGGALAVPAGNDVIPVLNAVARQAQKHRAVLYASRDWHPAESRHFVSSGGSWPTHCVAGTPGAEFHPALQLPRSTGIVDKGVAPDSDGYSVFDGTLRDGTGLLDDLQRQGIQHLIIGGLATDYCVRHSVLDARHHGFQVTVLTDGIAAVDLAQGDGTRALDEMRRAGATLQVSTSLTWS